MTFKYFSQNKSYGILAAMLEILLSITIATVVGLIAEDTSVVIILMFRYVFCLPFLLVIGLIQRGIKIFRVDSFYILSARIVFGILGLAVWFLAISSIGIIKSTVLGQLMPIFVIFFAPLFLKERLTLLGWFAVCFGFLGTLIILRPGYDGWWSIGIIFGILTPFFSALMNISLRSLGSTDWPITTAIWYNFAGAIVFTSIYFSADFSFNMEFKTLPYLLLIGIAASGQQYFLAFSRANCPAITLAPISYLMVPCSILIGLFILEEKVSLSFILGASIILLSAIYSVKEERMD